MSTTNLPPTFAAPPMAMDQPEGAFVIGPEHAGISMTPNEFDAIGPYDENYFYELIHGVLVVSPLPYVSETGPNEELGRMLLNYRDQHPQGRKLDATFPEQHVRTPKSRRRADRLIWPGLGRAPKLCFDSPSIAVEFVSQAKRDRRRDYVEKRDEYLAAGLVEYWVIDRFHRDMTVFRNSSAGVQQLMVHENESYQNVAAAGF